jgi:hypothetical protein
MGDKDRRCHEGRVKVHLHLLDTLGPKTWSGQYGLRPINVIKQLIVTDLIFMKYINLKTSERMEQNGQIPMILHEPGQRWGNASLITARFKTSNRMWSSRA